MSFNVTSIIGSSQLNYVEKIFQKLLSNGFCTNVCANSDQSSPQQLFRIKFLKLTLKEGEIAQESLFSAKTKVFNVFRI
jgi:hypothetical protein